MKRRFTMLIAAITALMFIIPTSLNAQEEKEKEIEKKIEKRIMIVTVDESGEKTVIDTTITGDSELEEIYLDDGMKWIKKGDENFKTVKTKDGNVFIVSGDDKKTFSIYSKEGNKVVNEEGEVYVINKGDKGSFSIVAVDEESEDGNKKINIHIDEDIVHTKDGNVIMKSSKSKGHSYIMKVSDDGEKNIAWVEKGKDLKDGQVHIVIHSRDEVEDLIIDGDAVITIKDGKVKVNAEGMKMNYKEEGALKEVKEKKVKKEIKKK